MWMGYKMYEPIASSEVALRFAQETKSIPVLRVHDVQAAYYFCLHVFYLFTDLGSTEDLAMLRYAC